MSVIHVEEGALNSLREAFLGAGQEYKENVAKMEHLVERIVSGDFQGDAAEDFKNKYYLDNNQLLVQSNESYIKNIVLK